MFVECCVILVRFEVVGKRLMVSLESLMALLEDLIALAREKCLIESFMNLMGVRFRLSC
jgi:hypothetical protein